MQRSSPPPVPIAAAHASQSPVSFFSRNWADMISFAGVLIVSLWPVDYSKDTLSRCDMQVGAHCLSCPVSANAGITQNRMHYPPGHS